MRWGGTAAFVALTAAGIACTSKGPAGVGADASASVATREAPQRCAECHLPEYEGARKHVGVKPTACAVCHFEQRWRPRPTPNQVRSPS